MFDDLGEKIDRIEALWTDENQILGRIALPIRLPPYRANWVGVAG
jgi:hypothetical protein